MSAEVKLSIPPTMMVFNGSSINTDTIKILIMNDEKTLFEHTYYYGYDVSWKKEFATKDKPFDKDLIEAKAKEFDAELNDVKYAEGVNVFRDK